VRSWLSAPVFEDPGQMEQVLLNLVLNARDAMQSGGQLHVRTRAVRPLTDDALSDAQVRIEVTDTGIGMDGDTQERAFDPFFTTKGRFEGTGLGLSTVYGIVRQADGTISLESRPGQGTTVRIVMPGCEAQPREEHGAPPGTQPIQGTETVLLAEDEPTVRRLMRRVLDANGYAVLEAPDGAEALALAARHKERIDLVITDVIMPELSGGAVAERMKDVHPESRALYVSGYAADAIARHRVQSEDAAFLAKPFTADERSRKVREVLDVPRG
jgi:CheY-like chemotaxis protein